MSSPRREHGAALLIAMLIVTLVATAAATMVWHQHKAIEVETAVRARDQAVWLLNVAPDWARLMMNTLPGTRSSDDLDNLVGEEIKESRLAAFLAVDRDNNSDLTLDVFFAGQARDATARYNLRNLLGADGKADAAEVAGLQRLCVAAGLSADTGAQLAQGLITAWTGAEDAPLPPARIDQLAWLGLPAEALAKLEPFVTLLPEHTPVNVNTAPPEVLVAAIDGLDLAGAARIVQEQPPDKRPGQNKGIKTLDQLRTLLPPNTKIEEGGKRISLHTKIIEVRAEIRMDDRIVEERLVLERRGGDLVTLQRERRSLQPPVR